MGDDPHDPPPEAYGRVTDAERFAGLHEWVAELLDRLVEDYDVARTDDVGLDASGESMSTVSLTPSQSDAAVLRVTFSGFPVLLSSSVGGPRRHTHIAAVMPVTSNPTSCSMDKRSYNTVRDRPVGVRTRPDDVTVHVMGEELPLTLGVERAARLIGVGRSTMYTAVKRGEFETIRLNGRTVLLTLPLLERIGVTVDTAARLATSE